MKSRKRWWKRGQGMVEYILILVLVSLVAIGIWKFIGQSIARRAHDAATTIETGEYTETDEVGTPGIPSYRGE